MEDIEEKYWDIAGIVIGVNGQKEMIAQFEKQFAGCELESQPECVDLKIRIVSSIDECEFKPKYFPLSGNINFNETTFSKKTNKYTYVIKNLFSVDMLTEVAIVDKEVVGIMEGINRAKYGRGKEYWKCQSYMNYALFWMIFAISLQKRDKAFIHSSISIINGKAVILCGTGGCGKTSTLFKLMENEKNVYLAEDFGIVDKNGRAYFNPKMVTMYASDVKYGQKDLVAYKEKMSGRDAAIWKVDCALNRNPRRRINPKELLGEERVGKDAEIALVVFLVREERDDTVCEDINKEDLIYRMTEATYRELKELFELLSNIHALGGKDIPYPSVEELKLRHSDILRSALENSRGCLCRVRRKGGPEEILAAVRKWSSTN